MISEEKENSVERTEKNNFSHEDSQKKDSWLDIVKFVLIVAAIVFPIRWFIAQPFLVSGPSMDPTFHDKDYLIVDEISYRFKNPKRGEGVVFKSPSDNRHLIKRVVGVPGDTLVLEGNTITVTNAENPEGFMFEQSFVVNKKSESKTTVILDGTDYFVLGDNRPVSNDSRYIGPVTKAQIVGRPLLRLYPFNQIGFLPGDNSE